MEFGEEEDMVVRERERRPESANLGQSGSPVPVFEDEHNTGGLAILRPCPLAIGLVSCPCCFGWELNSRELHSSASHISCFSLYFQSGHRKHSSPVR
jgi:hypothetical protein